MEDRSVGSCGRRSLNVNGPAWAVTPQVLGSKALELMRLDLRGRDLNPRPLGYEPNERRDCSIRR
jgi:hypothetical protein